MKVEIKEMLFKTIEKGEAFLFAGNAYIKSSFNGTYIGVKLSTGESMMLSPDDFVVPFRMKAVPDDE